MVPGEQCRRSSGLRRYLAPSEQKSRHLILSAGYVELGCLSWWTDPVSLQVQQMKWTRTARARTGSTAKARQGTPPAIDRCQIQTSGTSVEGIHNLVSSLISSAESTGRMRFETLFDISNWPGKRKVSCSSRLCAARRSRMACAMATMPIDLSEMLLFKRVRRRVSLLSSPHRACAKEADSGPFVTTRDYLFRPRTVAARICRH